MHFIFIWKPLHTNYRKIKCLRNILDFTVLAKHTPNPHDWLSAGTDSHAQTAWSSTEFGLCRLSIINILFLWFCRTWTKRYLITSQSRVKRVNRIYHRTIMNIAKPQLTTFPRASLVLKTAAAFRLTEFSLMCAFFLWFSLFHSRGSPFLIWFSFVT